MASQTTDVVIIGGGIQGCSAAWNLARAGVQVTLLEKDYIARHSLFVQKCGSEHMFSTDKMQLASECLFMPATRDWTPDYKFKQKWLHSLTAESREKLLGVFEDRNRVCEMWREEGVPCFQAAEGKY